MEKVELLIDWLQFTVKDKSIIEVLNDFNFIDFQVLDYGQWGYDRTLVIGEKIKLLYRSKDEDEWNKYYLVLDQLNEINFELSFRDDKELREKRNILKNAKNQIKHGLEDNSMGVHILLSGYACREIELLKSWNIILKYIVENEYKVTRIDLAYDVFDKKLLDINLVKKHFKNKKVRSKFKVMTEINTWEINGYKIKGQTINLGSPKSDLRFVIYDKLEERKVADYEVDESIKHWNRFEIRLRNNYAGQILKEIYKDIAAADQVVKALINEYICFLPLFKNHKGNVANWWLNFVGNDNLKLTNKAIQTSITKKEEWINKSVVKTLTSVMLADLEFVETLDQEKLFKFINEGIRKINNMDLKMINQERLRQGGSIIYDHDLIVIKEKLKEIINEKD